MLSKNSKNSNDVQGVVSEEQLQQAEEEVEEDGSQTSTSSTGPPSSDQERVHPTLGPPVVNTSGSGASSSSGAAGEDDDIFLQPRSTPGVHPRPPLSISKSSPSREKPWSPGVVAGQNLNPQFKNILDRIQQDDDEPIYVPTPMSPQEDCSVVSSGGVEVDDGGLRQEGPPPEVEDDTTTTGAVLPVPAASSMGNPSNRGKHLVQERVSHSRFPHSAEDDENSVPTLPPPQSCTETHRRLILASPDNNTLDETVTRIVEPVSPPPREPPTTKIADAVGTTVVENDACSIYPDAGGTSSDTPAASASSSSLAGISTTTNTNSPGNNNLHNLQEKGGHEEVGVVKVNTKNAAASSASCTTALTPGGGNTTVSSATTPGGALDRRTLDRRSAQLLRYTQTLGSKTALSSVLTASATSPQSARVPENDVQKSGKNTRGDHSTGVGVTSQQQRSVTPSRFGAPVRATRRVVVPLSARGSAEPTERRTTSPSRARATSKNFTSTSTTGTTGTSSATASRAYSPPRIQSARSRSAKAGTGRIPIAPRTSSPPVSARRSQTPRCSQVTRRNSAGEQHVAVPASIASSGAGGGDQL
ncbi:unnamed protein product [Amoebophrya sp. A25]|nr:unnamed protein product [Amoebophrya sp. A25]|eukprot:GSA25T00014710001.1